MRSSLATVSISGTLEDKLRAIAAAGFDGIELFEPDLIASPMTPSEVAQRVSDLGLTIELYQPFRDFEGMPGTLFQQNLRRAEMKLDLMTTLGAPMLLACSNVHPASIDDPDLAAEQLYALGDLAAARGIRVAYEALAWGRNVKHFWDATAIIRRCGHPAVGICLDSFHILSLGDGIEAIKEIAPESLFFVQLADAPALPMDTLRLSRHYRCFPGQGVFDLQKFTATLIEAGYRGTLSLEVFSDNVRAAPAGETARDARRSLLYLEDLTAQAVSTQVRSTVQLSRMRPIPKLDGVAFIEIAVAPKELSAFEKMLAKFGFVLAGTHRSKPITLWQQGDVRLVLNRSETVDGGPSVVALGLQLVDAQEAIERAVDLRLSLTTTPHGESEADLPSVTTPMGLKLLFCTATGAQRWRSDFIGSEESMIGDAASSVDHLGGAVSSDLFDAEVSLYRSLLGMTARPVAEINRPHGQLHSRALISPKARLRIAISSGVIGRAIPPGLQQIALKTHDVARTVGLLRGAGAPMLEIPDNYYADLATRYDLPPAKLTEMRDLGLLYDRSETGEFLHAYSAAIGSFFFEFVQRIGGYEGFGESDAPIRVASQEPR